MPVVSEMVHPLGLNFANQRKVVMLRDDKKMSWDAIAAEVVNLQGEPSTAGCVKRVYRRFNKKKERCSYGYSKCGRKRWKLTEDVQKYLVRRLLQLRNKVICTSTTLQSLLAKERGIKASASAIRKVLAAKGFQWLPRSQKRKYDRDDMKTREAWALPVSRMSAPKLQEKFAFAMDGVIIEVPPADPVQRHNHCMHGVTHIWRKRGEAAKPELAGEDPYADQVPLSRAIPLWGGISEGGFAEVIVHKKKKMTQDEWVGCVRAGKLTGAIRQLKPKLPRGPWHVICDNESFLHAKDSVKAYAARPLKMWHIPPRSPDLNPVEKFWGWLRRELRRRDLEDLRLKRPVLGKMACLRRVRAVLKTKKSQNMAKRFASSLKKTCVEVVAKKGAASRG